jgi:c-di-GMP-related signal transduction protein
MRASGYFKHRVRVEALKQKKLDELERNGITTKHLKENYDKGYHDALVWGTEYFQPFFYAAIAIVAKRELKYGKTRNLRLLEDIQQTMLEEITVYDILDRAKQETGIDIKEWYQKSEVV